MVERLVKFDKDRMNLVSITISLMMLAMMYLIYSVYLTVMGVSLTPEMVENIMMSFVSGCWLIMSITYIFDKRLISLVCFLFYEICQQIMADAGIFDSVYIVMILAAITLHLFNVIKLSNDEFDGFNLGDNPGDRLVNALNYDFKIVSPPITFKLMTYGLMAVSAYVVYSMTYASTGMQFDNFSGAMLYTFILIMLAVDVPDSAYLWMLMFCIGISRSLIGIMNQTTEYGIITVLTSIVEQTLYLATLVKALLVNSKNEYVVSKLGRVPME